MTTSFADLDRARGIEMSKSESQSSLEDWYLRIRHTPIVELSDGDLFRSVRQKIYLDHVIPEVVKRLVVDPLAGEMYDGEGVAAAAGLKPDLWASYPRESTLLRQAVRGALDRMDGDVRSDAERLLSVLDVKRA